MNNKLYTDPTYQRFKKYKKKYSLGDNFDLNLKESNSEVYLKDKVNWERARTEFKLSKKQMLELIDKGEVSHTWQDSINKDRSYKGCLLYTSDAADE